MSPSETREFWKEVIQLQKESGQTIASFLKSEGLPEHRYYYWRKRLSEPKPKPAEPEFVPVSFSEMNTAGEMIVVRSGSFSIDVMPGFNPSVLAQVLEVTAGVRC